MSYKFSLLPELEETPAPCFDFPVVKKALERVKEKSSQEHAVYSVITALLQNYFPIKHGWLITPEQRQEGGKIPDYVIQGLDSTYQEPRLEYHIHVECKKDKGLDFTKILQQLSNQMVDIMDKVRSINLFSIAVLGTRILFMEYHNYRDHLSDLKVPQYLGLIPLRYNNYPDIQELITKKVEMDLNPVRKREDEQELPDKNLRLDIWDLRNPDHHPYIHQFFTHMIHNQPTSFPE